MPWQVSRILRLWQVYPHVLPPGKFVLVNPAGQKKKQSLDGCHAITATSSMNLRLNPMEILPASYV